jgi:hypothetical protein
MSEQRVVAVILILIGLVTLVFARAFVEGRLLGWIDDESWIRANAVAVALMGLGVTGFGVYLLIR